MEKIPTWLYTAVGVFLVCASAFAFVVHLVIDSNNHRLARIEGDDAAVRAVVEGLVPNVAGLVVRAEKAAENCRVVREDLRALEDRVDRLQNDPSARKDSFTGSDGRALRGELVDSLSALRVRVERNDSRLDEVERELARNGKK